MAEAAETFVCSLFKTCNTTICFLLQRDPAMEMALWGYSHFLLHAQMVSAIKASEVVEFLLGNLPRV